MSKSIAIIDQNVKFKGDFISKGFVDIMGHCQGTIIADTVIIKQNANILGNVLGVSSIIVEGGYVVGDIYAKSIKLMKNAVITGNIFYNKLSVEDGAIVNGLCQKCENEELDNRINISLENFHNNENFITTNLSSGSQSSQKIDQNDISISDKSENSNIAISCNNSAVINDEDII